MKIEYRERMKRLLGDEFALYEQSLDKPMLKGIRMNPKKISVEYMQKQYGLVQVPFCKEGFYAIDALNGNHVLHKAGAYYMQEPSAMSVVEVLDVQANDWVLDLCAAPGGKSTQVASKLGENGMLVSNDFVLKRASILVSNLERMGACNYMVTSSSTKALCEAFQGHFDKVVVDAPCSGEGMFKKHDAALRAWSQINVEACAKRQLEILEDAYLALKQDGILVYSTCTYAVEENEAVIHVFMSRHSDIELVDIEQAFGRSGVPYKDLEHDKVRRIYPMDGGEGHFIAKLKKTGTQAASKLKMNKQVNIDQTAIKTIQSIKDGDYTYYYQKDNKIYAMYQPFILLDKIHILRQGVYCGELLKGRFEVHHQLFMVQGSTFKRVENCTLEEAIQYIKGNYIDRCIAKGYVALQYEGVIFGFGKSDGQVIKNKYPKGLRIV